MVKISEIESMGEYEQFEIDEGFLKVSSPSMASVFASQRMKRKTGMYPHCKLMKDKNGRLITRCSFDIDTKRDIGRVIKGIDYGVQNRRIIKNLEEEFEG